MLEQLEQQWEERTMMSKATKQMEQIMVDPAAKMAADGTVLLAITGISAALAKSVIKITRTDIKKAVELPKTVAETCYEFLSTKGFKKIKLDLPEINYLDTIEIISTTMDAETLADKISQVPESIRPQYGAALLDSLGMLLNSAPKLPVSITSSKVRPSDFEVAKFERTYRTINDPLTVLKDMTMGCLSRQQVDTMLGVYPNLYELISTGLSAAAARILEKDPEYIVPYDKLKMLSVFHLNTTVPADLIQYLQSNFAKQDISMNQGPKHTPQVADMQETSAQRIQQK